MHVSTDKNDTSYIDPGRDEIGKPSNPTKKKAAHPGSTKSNIANGLLARLLQNIDDPIAKFATFKKNAI